MNATVLPDGSIRVESETAPGKTYRVSFLGVDGLPRFTCTPEQYRRSAPDHGVTTGTRGRTPCKHARAAAELLEAAGLIVHGIDGDGCTGWMLTPVAATLAAVPATDADFDGLT